MLLSLLIYNFIAEKYEKEAKKIQGCQILRGNTPFASAIIYLHRKKFQFSPCLQSGSPNWASGLGNYIQTCIFTQNSSSITKCVVLGLGHVVLLLDGNSENGAHVRSNLSCLTCLRHLIRSRALSNQIFSSEKTLLLHACATCSELPSNKCTMHYRK